MEEDTTEDTGAPERPASGEAVEAGDNATHDEGEAEQRDAPPSAMTPDTTTPEEVLAMAHYLGIAVERGELYLLGVAREAVSAPVLPPWQELEDAQGNPYFYNHHTRDSSRRHPLDSQFLKLVTTMRERHGAKHVEASSYSWMEFGAEESTWYDFATGESATAPPDGALQVPGVDVDLLPVYDVGTLGMSPELPGALAFQRPLVRPDLVNRDGVLRELTFKSWWVEDNEQPNYGNGMSTGGCLRKRYVTVTFDIYAQSFSLHLDNDEAVSLYNLLSVTAKNGRPIQCWDLHVGAKLNLLGKSTTLMQGSQHTLDWLDRHTKRLTKIKEELIGEILKYETRKLVGAVSYHRAGDVAARTAVKGGTSLRMLTEQIEKLTLTLLQFRPKLAQKYASRAAQPP